MVGGPDAGIGRPVMQQGGTNAVASGANGGTNNVVNSGSTANSGLSTIGGVIQSQAGASGATGGSVLSDVNGASTLNQPFQPSSMVRSSTMRNVKLEFDLTQIDTMSSEELKDLVKQSAIFMNKLEQTRKQSSKLTAIEEDNVNNMPVLKIMDDNQRMRENKVDLYRNNDDVWLERLTLLADKINSSNMSALNTSSTYPKEKNINSTQRTFSGKVNENVNQWLMQMNLNLKSANVPDERKLIVAVGYLLDGALQFFESEQRKGFITWNTFQKALKERFQPANYQTILYNKLNSLKQTGALNKHLEQFDYLMNQTEDIPEHIKVTLFTKSLSKDISENVEYRRPKNVAEAIQLAIDYNNSFKKDEVEVNAMRAKKNNSNKQVSKTFIKCFICEGNHRMAECPTKTQLKSKPTPRTTRNDTKVNRNQSYQQNATNFYKQKQFEKNKQLTLCTYCGKTNHTENECYKKMRSLMEQMKKEEDEDTAMEINRVNSRPTQLRSVSYSDQQQVLLKAIGKINGDKVHMIFDSGAMSSVVSKRLAEHLELPMSDESVSVVFANGRREEAIFTSPVTITIFGISVDVKMIVLNNDDKPVLIGLDWMAEAGAVLDLGNKTINFGSRTFNFNTNEDVDDEEGETEVNQCAVSEVDVLNDDDLESIDHTYEDEAKSDEELIIISEAQMHHLDDNVKSKLVQIVKDYKGVFADKMSDLRKPAKIPKFKILTVDEVPVYQPIYRINRLQRQRIDQVIQQYLDAGLIRHSTSPWSAQLVPVNKKDGEIRPCCNFKGLNAKTIKNNGPLIRGDDTFDNLSESNVFSHFDLKACFHQQELDEDSRRVKSEIKLLGHIISVDGLKMDPAKIEVVKN
jgi:hypothetical protein